jgi:hypothetical protein
VLERQQLWLIKSVGEERRGKEASVWKFSSSSDERSNVNLDVVRFGGLRRALRSLRPPSGRVPRPNYSRFLFSFHNHYAINDCYCFIHFVHIFLPFFLIFSNIFTSFPPINSPVHAHTHSPCCRSKEARHASRESVVSAGSPRANQPAGRACPRPARPTAAALILILCFSLNFFRVSFHVLGSRL